MNLASPGALLLFGTIGVLLWLALRPRRPRPMAVGTLMLWARVSSRTQESSQRTRQLDALLWLLAAALAVGAFAAARPQWVAASGAPLVDVFIERLDVTGPEPGLDALVLELRAVAPGADLRFWSAGDLPGMSGGDVRTLQPGPLEAEVAQFEAGAGPCRIYALCNPEARPGLVVARARGPREGVLFEAGVTDGELVLRLAGATPPVVNGATITSRQSRGRELEVRAEIQASEIHVTLPDRAVTLRQRALVVGVGEDWTGARHAALLRALQPDMTGARQPELWLGGAQGVPGIRINQGAPATAGEVHVDAQHPLFRELPLGQVQWGALAMPSQADRRTLARAAGGGDLAALSADGEVLYFAGDPFTDSSVAAATLLLDNAIGVLTGLRASQRQSHAIDGPLPSRRQAMADSFTPVGTLPPMTAVESNVELGLWLMLAAAACSLVAAFTGLRRAGGAPPA